MRKALESFLHSVLDSLYWEPPSRLGTITPLRLANASNSKIYSKGPRCLTFATPHCPGVPLANWLLE